MEVKFTEYDGASISTLGAAAEKLDKEVKRLDAELSTAKEELNHLLTFRIPRKLEEEGLTAVDMPSGRRLKLDEKFFCNVLVGDKPELNEWLRDNGYGDLIKEEVNPNTLKAWAKGRVEAMEEVPPMCKISTSTVAKFTK